MFSPQLDSYDESDNRGENDDAVLFFIFYLSSHSFTTQLLIHPLRHGLDQPCNFFSFTFLHTRSKLVSAIQFIYLARLGPAGATSCTGDEHGTGSALVLNVYCSLLLLISALLVLVFFFLQLWWLGGRRKRWRLVGRNGACYVDSFGCLERRGIKTTGKMGR